MKDWRWTPVFIWPNDPFWVPIDDFGAKSGAKGVQIHQFAFLSEEADFLLSTYILKAEEQLADKEKKKRQRKSKREWEKAVVWNALVGTPGTPNTKNNSMCTLFNILIANLKSKVYWAWIKTQLDLVRDSYWVGLGFGGHYWAWFVNGYPGPIV